MTRLPHTDGGTFITDGGMETTLIFHGGLELPEFASFVLLDDPAGTEALLTYYEPYLEIARRRGVAILLDAPTWRANRDWGERLGYSPEALADVNRRGVALLEGLRSATGGDPEIVISGCIGPRGDAYRVDDAMTPAEAETLPRSAGRDVRAHVSRPDQRADARLRGRGRRHRARRRQD